MARFALKPKSKISDELVHAFIREWRAQGPTSSAVLVAVSGGLDSVVLLDLLARTQKLLKLELAIAHVHHGPTPSKTQKAYRQKALNFSRELAAAYELPFFTNENAPTSALKSEAAMREFRYAQLSLLQKAWNPSASRQVLATAHHGDDLLETRVLRLIRGTGPQGLRAMEYWTDEKVRPLLPFLRAQLLNYARRLKLTWLKDPSNRETDYLRNWLRGSWFKSLERRVPGATAALARSLELLVASDDMLKGAMESVLQHSALNRRAFLDLRREDQRRALAAYLKSLNVAHYSHSHINELVKRLDNSQKDLTFVLLKCEWTAGPDWIKARRIVSSRRHSN